MQIEGGNLIFLLIDALRADHLPCYGYGRNTTPAICEASREGIVFEKAISQSSWTKPAMASLFTSTYPHNHAAVEWDSVLPSDVFTLAEALKSHGYYTAAFQTNPFMKDAHNFHQGFDRYSMYENLTRAEKIVDEFIREMSQKKPDKFFAYLHFMDLHLPYNPPEEYIGHFQTDYDGPLNKREFNELWPVKEGQLILSEADKQHVISLYDAEILYVDQQVKRLLDYLTESRLFENTIIVILSDHGEELWDHEGFEHGHSMYNEVLRTPLIILNPRLEATDLRIKTVVRLIDLFPTLMRMLKLPIPSSVMGLDLVEEIVHPDPDLNLVVFSEGILYGAGKMAVQTNSHKMIIRLEDLSTEFYDLRVDPSEKNNLKNSQLAKDYEEMAWFFSTYSRGTDHKLERRDFDKKTLEALKSLGYIR